MDWQSEAATPLARGLSMPDREALGKAIATADQARSKGDQKSLVGRWLNIRPDPLDFRDCWYEPGLIDLATCRRPDPLMAELAVRDQGYLSSCTGMALAFAIDLLRLRQWRAGGGSGADRPLPVSARMLFEMARAFDEFPEDGLPGSSLRGALRGFFHNGVCNEVPEDDHPERVLPGQWRFTVAKAKEARSVSLGVYRRLHHVLLDYHAALNDLGVVLVSAQVHEGWLGRAPKQNRGRIAWAGGRAGQGGHAFALVGYDQDGFLVRNSAGRHWGGWADRDGSVLPGVAHWSYADWERNVMDAWVIHLAVPLGRPFHVTGGPFAPGTGRRSSPSHSATRIQINGHYLNVRDGRLVRAGAFNSDEQSLDETGRLLEATKDYDHLALIVESGLESFDSMVERAAFLTPYMKAARIYPFFVIWQENVFATAGELLEDRARRLEPRTGGLAPLQALLLENFARDFMQPIWRTFEGEVERSFDATDRQRGRMWETLRPVLDGAIAGENPLRLHFVAHGTGALWLRRLFARMATEREPPSGGYASRIGTINLLAPVCDSKAMQDALVRLLEERTPPEADAPQTVAVYTLAEEHDAADQVGAYQGSFVELARHVFPVAGGVAGDSPHCVLGHETGARWLEEEPDRVRYCVTDKAVGSSCRTHRALASDSAVLKHVLGRIVGDAAVASSIGKLPLDALRSDW